MGEKDFEQIDPEEIEELWEDENIPSGGGGSKKKSGKLSEKARKRKRDELLAYSIEKSREEARISLRTVITSFPSDMGDEKEDAYFRNYIDWINDHLAQKDLDIPDREFRVDNFTPHVHAGGQGMQKSSSGVRAVHIPTNIDGNMSKGGRSPEQKEKQAKQIATEKIKDHLGDWKIYLKQKDMSTREADVQDLYEIVVG